MKKYFYKLLGRYLSLYVRPDDSIVEINPSSNILLNYFGNAKAVFTDPAFAANVPSKDHSTTDFETTISGETDFILISGNIHYEKDIQAFLEKINKSSKNSTRVIILYYSRLWKPLVALATLLKFRKKMPEENWIAHQDIDNFLVLSNFELIKRDSKVLIPFYIPLFSNLINRYVAPLPFFNLFTMVNIVVAKPVNKIKETHTMPSVSVVVAARNEEGNIENIVKRIR